VQTGRLPAATTSPRGTGSAQTDDGWARITDEPG